MSRAMKGDHSGTERHPFADASGKQSVAQVTSSIAENFSITRGGPLHWLLVRLGQAGDGRLLVLRRALFVVLITWLPLLLLSVVGAWPGDDRSTSLSFVILLSTCVF